MPRAWFAAWQRTINRCVRVPRNGRVPLLRLHSLSVPAWTTAPSSTSPTSMTGQQERVVMVSMNVPNEVCDLIITIHDIAEGERVPQCTRSSARRVNSISSIPASCMRTCPIVLVVSGRGLKPQLCFDVTYTDQGWTALTKSFLPAALIAQCCRRPARQWVNP